MLPILDIFEEMSTAEVEEGESNSANAEETSANPTRTNNDTEGGAKVVFLLKAAGGAPILKKKKWALPRTKTMGYIVEFLKKFMQLDPQEHPQLILYVNQAFAPALDTTLGAVNDCFSSEGTLVLHYSVTPAWG